MNKPLVTIITPAYNCAKFIAETIDSVLDNGYENIEYIVLDDCSTDETPKVLAWYNEAFIKSRSQTNIGEQKTVNDGLRMLSGKYFMIVNADDPLLNGAISALVDFMEKNPEVLCAYPDWDSISEDGLYKAYIKSRDYDFRYMVKHHTCLPSVGSMFRSSVIQSVGYRDPRFWWVSDFDYWLRIGLAGQMAHVPLTLAQWRHRDGQASGSKSDSRAQDHIKLMQKFYSLSNIPDEILEVRREATCWSYLVAATVTDSKLKVLCYIAKAFLSHPLISFSIEFWDIVRRRALHYLRR